MADLNVPWATHDDGFNAGMTGGASSPSSNLPAATEDVNVPWGGNAQTEAATGIKEEGSVWESIKKDWAAGVDAIAAGMLQDESSDRSRYAMKRAERTNLASQAAEEKLTGGQKLMAEAGGRIAPGLAAATVPVVGPALGATIFGAQETSDVLRQQAQETGRYDLTKATQAGVAAAGLAELGGGFLGRTGNVVSRTAKAATEGAGIGGGTQVITNLATGRPINENVGTAAMAGVIGGGVVHGATEGLGAFERLTRPAPRMPTTGAEAEQAYRERMQQPTPGQAPDADFGAAPTEGPAPQRGEEGFQPIPGTENMNPNDYGPEVSGSPMGMGFGPGGARPAAKEGTVSEELKSTFVNPVKGLYNSLTQGGVQEAVAPKGAKFATEAEMADEKLGINVKPEFHEAVADTEKSLDILQQRLENTPAGTPEYDETLRAVNNLSGNYGSAAARNRTNMLVGKSDLVTTSKFHDVDIDQGLMSGGPKNNLATDVYSIPRADIETEHVAVHKSEKASFPTLKRYNRRIEENLGNFESFFNEAHAGYKRGQNIAYDAFDNNYTLAKNIQNSVDKNSQPQTWEAAATLAGDLDNYRNMAKKISNGGEINKSQLDILSKRIVDNSTRLGLSPKMKNVAGEAGTFNPILDMQAWDGFHKSTIQMNPSIPKGNLKQALEKTEGFAKGNMLTSAINTGLGLATATMRRQQSVKSQMRGRKIAEGNIAPVRRAEPATADEVQAALKAGDVESAASAAEQELKDSGINTGAPETAAPEAAPSAPVEPVVPQEAPVTAPEPTTAPEATTTPPTEPTAPTEAPAAPEVPKSGPVPVSRPAPKAEPVAEPEVPVEPAAEPTPKETLPQRPKAKETPAETPTEEAPKMASVKQHADLARLGYERAGDESLTADEAHVALETLKQHNAQKAGNASAEQMANRPAPKAEPEAPVTEEAPAPKAEPLPMQPKAKTPEEVQAVHEEVKQKQDAVVEEAKVEEPVAKEITQELPQESQADRTNRLASMAKKLVNKAADKIERLPAAKRSAKDLAHAEGMKTGMEVVARQLSDISKRNNINEADLWEAIMNHPDGIEHVFSQGYKSKAIEGRLRTTIADARHKAANTAADHVNQAEGIIRKSLNKNNVQTKEKTEAEFKADLKSKGMDDEVINEAFKRAEKVTPNYTLRQVGNHAKTILAEKAEALKNKPTEKTFLPVKASRNALMEFVDNLGLEGRKREEIRSIVRKETHEGLTGARAALTPEQEARVIGKIQSNLEKDKDVLDRAAKDSKDTKKRATFESKAQKIADALEGFDSAKSVLEKRRSESATAEKAKVEQMEKQRTDIQDQIKKMNELKSHVENLISTHEKNVANAAKEARESLGEAADQMSGSELEMAGGLISEKMPEADSVNDPDFIQWKAEMETLADKLKEKGRGKPAGIVRTLLNIYETGLKRKEELPGNKDLILAEPEYQELNKAIGADENGNTSIDNAMHNYYGNLGLKIRSALFGDSSPSARSRYIRYSKKEIEALRAKAKPVGEAGTNAPGIKEK